MNIGHPGNMQKKWYRFGLGRNRVWAAGAVRNLDRAPPWPGGGEVEVEPASRGLTGFDPRA
jgi:hypothetical protein